MSGILNSYTICVFSQILQIGIFAPKRREILICKIIVIKLRYKIIEIFFFLIFFYYKVANYSIYREKEYCYFYGCSCNIYKF